MKFNDKVHRCTIVINNNIPVGLAMNAASVIGINLGQKIENLVGPDMQSLDGVSYPGVIYSPLPVLLASGEYINEILAAAENAEGIYVMPFSALAQSCKTYGEYGEKISSVNSENIELVAIGIVGEKKKIAKMTGALSLYK